MAKKTKKTNKVNLPNWVKSKWFLLGAALIIAVVAVLGFNSFAASLPVYPTSYSTCKTKVLYKGGPNNTRDCVKYAQDRLNYACMTIWPYTYDLTVDGLFGDATKAKVQGFQSKTGLYSDGVIGPNTWTKLSYYYGNGKSNSLICRY